jgi:hypothetical protein
MKSVHRRAAEFRMKVLHAAKVYPPVPGGMETLVQSLCNEISPGWDVRVVAAHQ